MIMPVACHHQIEVIELLNTFVTPAPVNANLSLAIIILAFFVFRPTLSKFCPHQFE